MSTAAMELPTKLTPPYDGAESCTLASMFEAVCARFPARTAVCLGSESMTYADLHTAAHTVARSLTAKGLPHNALVAIYLDRGMDMVVAMLGVVLAGAAYVPLDPTAPPERIRETLRDAGPFAVLSNEEGAQLLAGSGAQIFTVSSLRNQGSQQFATNVGAAVMADDLAYVIYTSGSTGKPKGVMVSHHNVVRLLQQTEAWFHFNEHDVWTMFHSFAFDFSVWEMWGCLLYGGRLVLVPYAISRSPEEFHALLAAERVTVLNQTPTAFTMLVAAESHIAARAKSLAALSLRVVILGGEALNLRSLTPWFERHGDATPEIVNMYGITETTVHVTYRRIRAAEAANETDSLIGAPIPDLGLHLLDHTLRPVSDGEVGEICVSGPGVALGYLHRDELTRERFLADMASMRHGRLYRSGDLARRRADGELVYMGRADRQVKLNGFRIELGEVEAVLAAHADVEQVCVIDMTDAVAGTRLAAYVVSRASSNFDAKALTTFAAAHLPPHMRPSFYTSMDSLPININGKLDRASLPQPGRVASGAPAQGSALENLISEVWAEKLGTAAIGLDDNFFDVGGTSLLLIAVKAALEDKLVRSIPVTWLFEHATVRAFAQRLAQPTASTDARSSALEQRAQQQRASFARMKPPARGAR